MFTCSCCQNILAEFQPMRKLFHSKRWQHVAQCVMDVRTQLPIRLPIQHAKQNALQSSFCDVQIWARDNINTIRVTVSRWDMLIKVSLDFYSLIVASLLSPALFARLMAYAHTSAASLWASCLRQATAARRSNRWELHKCTCIAKHNKKLWLRLKQFISTLFVVQ